MFFDVCRFSSRLSPPALRPGGVRYWPALSAVLAFAEGKGCRGQYLREWPPGAVFCIRPRVRRSIPPVTELRGCPMTRRFELWSPREYRCFHRPILQFDFCGGIYVSGNDRISFVNYTANGYILQPGQYRNWYSVWCERGINPF